MLSQQSSSIWNNSMALQNENAMRTKMDMMNQFDARILDRKYCQVSFAFHRQDRVKEEGYFSYFILRRHHARWSLAVYSFSLVDTGIPAFLLLPTAHSRPSALSLQLSSFGSRPSARFVALVLQILSFNFRPSAPVFQLPSFSCHPSALVLHEIS